MQPDEPKTLGEFEQIVDGLKNTNNVLVTISTDPSVDQFAACIGLTLVLNKLGKHANAVFSGAIPSTIDFLKPEDTIEKNTNSLRDFIIALDKSKADKLRYKVEDDVVKIFITPYKTSISEKDLEYSQGDFNVDAVVAIGVQEKNHLDSAILNHGKILHDATVMTVNTKVGAKLGSINWAESGVSSLCEMVADIARELSKDVFDKQNATALLTGVVAETDRYSNEKATPHTMSVAGILMSAGASTQLVSTKLEAQKEEVLPPVAEQTEGEVKDDGVIEIQHEEPDEDKPAKPAEPEAEINPVDQIKIDEQGSLEKVDELESEKADKPKNRVISEPPSLGGRLTANSEPTDQQYSGSTDPLSNLPNQGVLTRGPTAYEPPGFVPAPSDVSENVSLTLDVPSHQKPDEPSEPETDNKTLAEIEESVGSSKAGLKPTDEPDQTIDNPVAEPISDENLEQARKAVELAEENAEIDSPIPKSRQDIGSVPFDPNAPTPTPINSEPEPIPLSSDESTDSKNEENPSGPPPSVPPPLVPET